MWGNASLWDSRPDIPIAGFLLAFLILTLFVGVWTRRKMITRLSITSLILGFCFPSFVDDLLPFCEDE